MTYNIIWQAVNDTGPHTTLHNMGLTHDPQNKNGIPDKIYIQYSR